MFLRQLFIAMTFEELKDKALSLPLEPGVYLMQDKSGQIIYVGKAKVLKNRVRQYFVGAHDLKTTRLVANIDDFDASRYTLDRATMTVMDRWLLSRLNTLITEVDGHLENYRIPEAARALQDFVE